MCIQSYFYHELLLLFRFYFTDQTKVSRSTRGENSVVQMIGSLLDSIEADYGVFATRIYRALRPKPRKKYILFVN